MLQPERPAKVTDHQAEQVDALVAEIFELTGHKVTRDDPILLAALFQSGVMKRAGDNAAALFQDTVAKSVAELAEAVKAEREQAADLDRTVARAFQQIADGAKKAGDQELSTMQARFARMASETLENIRRESARQAPGGIWWKFAAFLGAGAAASLLGGVLLGKEMAPKLSDDQLRLMHNGMLLDEVWPRLPKVSRDLFGAAPRPNSAPEAAKTVPKGQ